MALVSSTTKLYLLGKPLNFSKHPRSYQKQGGNPAWLAALLRGLVLVRSFGGHLLSSTPDAGDTTANGTDPAHSEGLSFSERARQ